MVAVTISENQWVEMKSDLTNKNQFEHEIYNILINQQVIILPEDSKIILPNIVTVAERHKMHILTRNGFVPKSIGGGTNRYMELIISKQFFENLHEQFQEIEEVVIDEIEIEIQPNPIDVLKKAILDDIMIIVEKHLNSEFLKFYV